MIKTATAPTPTQVEPDDLTEERPSVPVVDFVDPQANTETEDDAEKTPSERNVSITSEHVDATKAVEAGSTTTAPSLFTDDISTPQKGAEADFFSLTMATIRSSVSEQARITYQSMLTIRLSLRLSAYGQVLR